MTALQRREQISAMGRGLASIIPAVAGLWACSAASPDGQAQSPAVSQDSIRLVGTINAESLRRVQQELTPQTRRIIINSAGGRGPEAIELGSLVRSRNLEVVVDGVCLSACAHFVFLPANSKRIEDNSVVAFHQTATAISELLIASGRPDLAAWYLPFAEKEQNFYTGLGISREILLGPLSEILPICYREVPTVPSDSEYRTVTFTTFTFYVPTLPDLYQQGVTKIEGNWPTSVDQIRRAVSRYPRQLRATFKMKLGTEREGKRTPRPLRSCPEQPAFQVSRLPR